MWVWLFMPMHNPKGNVTTGDPYIIIVFYLDEFKWLYGLNFFDLLVMSEQVRKI
jgi:hypothetical protein